MGDIALITGGGGTLGTAVAERLKEKNCRVVLAGRTQDKLESSPLTEALKVTVDLSNWNDVEQLFHAIDKEYGAPPSLLAHCAGSVGTRCRCSQHEESAQDSHEQTDDFDERIEQ